MSDIDPMLTRQMALDAAVTARGGLIGRGGVLTSPETAQDVSEPSGTAAATVPATPATPPLLGVTIGVAL